MLKKMLSDKRFAIILLSALVRMSIFGFRYYPMLDDYIQYGCYPNINNAYFKIGLYSTRPLAGIFDIYVWGRLWNKMWIALLIITILHALSAYFFLLTSEKLKLPLGMLFAVIYVLCPLNIEGSYWISASSRLIIPLFFASISFLFLCSKKYTPFFIFQLLSLLFYEQVIVFSLLVSFFIALKQKSRQGLFIITMNLVFIVSYYLLLSTTGSFGNRSDVTHLNFKALSDIASSWNMLWIPKDFINGFAIGGIWLSVIVVILGLFYDSDGNKFSIKMFILGILIFVLSYFPFFILKNYNVALRNNFVPLIGLAISIDALFSNFKSKYVFTSLLAICFIITTFTELNYYKQNYYVDRQIIRYVAENLNYNVPNSVTDTKRRYINTNFDFGEHVLSVTSSDWALTGAVREYLHDYNLKISLNAKNNKDINLISLKWCDKIGKNKLGVVK